MSTKPEPKLGDILDVPALQSLMGKRPKDDRLL